MGGGGDREGPGGGVGLPARAGLQPERRLHRRPCRREMAFGFGLICRTRVQLFNIRIDHWISTHGRAHG